MGRQIFFFILVCAAWAPVMSYAQSDFWIIWIELKAAGEVSNGDYYSTWQRYLIPYTALFALTISPVIIWSSLSSVPRSIRRKGRAASRLWRRVWYAY